MSALGAPHEQTTGSERKISALRKWRRRGRVVLMLVAFLLAARLFFSSRERPPQQVIPDPVGEGTLAGLSMEQVRAPMKQAALLAAHCRPPAGMAGEEVVVEVVFDGGGRPRHVEVLTEGVRGTETANCIELNFQRVRLPSPSRGELRLRQSFPVGS